jgi:hypothetical protein
LERITVQQPFEKIGIDLIGPFPLSRDGNRHVIIFLDYLTKWVIAKAVPATNTVEVVKFFIQRVLLQHGAPLNVISDRALVPAFSEFLVPVVFTSFKPFLLREKRVPPTLVIIGRLGFQSLFFTQIKISSFHCLFFVYFPFFRRQNIKNFKKLNFLLIRACS